MRPKKNRGSQTQDLLGSTIELDKHIDVTDMLLWIKNPLTIERSKLKVDPLIFRLIWAYSRVRLDMEGIILWTGLFQCDSEKRTYVRTKRVLRTNQRPVVRYLLTSWRRRLTGDSVRAVLWKAAWDRRCRACAVRSASRLWKPCGG